MTSEIIAQIRSMGKAHLTAEDTEKAKIRATILEMTAANDYLYEILDRWVRHEEENLHLRAENQALDTELELLRIASLAEEPVLPPRPVYYPLHGPVTATEVLDLYSRLVERNDPVLRGKFHSKLKALPPDEAKILLDTFTQTQTPSSMYVVGLCHEYGVGVPPNKEIATEWYTRSANLGYPFGMNNLGSSLEEKGLKDEAFQWYQRSAQLGNPLGMLRVGLCFDRGIGTTVDHDKAIEWYTRSADLGEPKAMAVLATNLMLGPTDDDHTKALEWFTKGIHLNCSGSKMLMGTGILAGKLSGDKLTGAKYMYIGYRDIGNIPEIIRTVIQNVIREQLAEFLERWIREEDDAESLRARNRCLHTEVDMLRTELEYRPGGPGYGEAREDFELRSGSRSVPSDLGLDT